MGAAENYRPTATDGCNITATGADSAQDIISFSSRGPTTDSRVKPDIVAPGAHIMGSASQDPGFDGSGPVAFNIQDGSGGNTYYGVVITPTAAMGNVTVVIQGNQSCTTLAVKRCFNITPGTPQTATIQFFYRAVEENSQAMPSVWHWNSTSHTWEALVSTYGGTGEAKWSRATVTSYSPFSLSNSRPTFVRLMSFAASSGRAVALPLLLFGCLLSLGAVAWTRRCSD